MCDLGLALLAGSTILGAAGQVQSANAQAAASNYNAQVQDMNARISERRARDAVDRGQVEEQAHRRKVAQLTGQQTAAMAANGVDVSFGSSLDTLVDTAMMGELDALQIRSNATSEAYDRRVDATNQRAGATLSRMEAKAAKTGGYLAAAGTILSGAAKGYGQYKAKTPGNVPSYAGGW